MTRAPSWHEHEVSVLTAMWTDGATAREIGATLGKTRNAVIGKASRLNLARKGKPKAPKRPRVRKKRQNASAAFRVAPRPIPPIEPVAGGVGLMDLEHHHCRAIVGSGPDGLARYCGAPKEGWITTRGGKVLSAYCVRHGNLYYRRDTQRAA